MDPKALASLDPKLRETYEKVMGTSTAPSSRASGPTMASPMSAINNSPIVMAQSPLQAQDFTTLQATPTGIPLPTTPQGSPVQLGKTMQPLPSPASINKTVAPPTQSSPVIRILYIIASIIFFAVYTVFWLKIFKYPIPFLPF